MYNPQLRIHPKVVEHITKTDMTLIQCRHDFDTMQAADIQYNLYKHKFNPN